MLTSVCVEHADYVWITLAVFKIYKLLHFHYRTFIELKVDTIKSNHCNMHICSYTLNKFDNILTDVVFVIVF